MAIAAAIAFHVAGGSVSQEIFQDGPLEDLSNCGTATSDATTMERGSRVLKVNIGRIDPRTDAKFACEQLVVSYPQCCDTLFGWFIVHDILQSHMLHRIANIQALLTCMIHVYYVLFTDTFTNDTKTALASLMMFDFLMRICRVVASRGQLIVRAPIYWIDFLFVTLAIICAFDETLPKELFRVTLLRVLVFCIRDSSDGPVTPPRPWNSTNMFGWSPPRWGVIPAVSCVAHVCPNVCPTCCQMFEQVLLCLNGFEWRVDKRREEDFMYAAYVQEQDISSLNQCLEEMDCDGDGCVSSSDLRELFSFPLLSLPSSFPLQGTPLDPLGPLFGLLGTNSIDEVVWLYAAAVFVFSTFFSDRDHYVDRRIYDDRLREKETYVRKMMALLDVDMHVLSTLWDRAVSSNVHISASDSVCNHCSQTALLESLICLQREALNLRDIPVVFTIDFTGPTNASVARVDGEAFDLPEIPPVGISTAWVTEQLRDIGAVSSGRRVQLLTPAGEILQDTEALLGARTSKRIDKE